MEPRPEPPQHYQEEEVEPGIDTEVVKPWDFPPQKLVPPPKES